MLSQWSIKRYINRLNIKLEQRFGQQVSYSASQVRTVVYQRNFNPKHLALGYIIALNEHDLSDVLSNEFPDLCKSTYIKQIISTLSSSKIFALEQQCANNLLNN